MIKIDSDLLDELGLNGLNSDEKNDAIEAIRNTLNEQVGDRAMDVLSDNQVEQLEKHMLEGTAEGTSQWLQSTVANYKDIVVQEFAKIKDKVKAHGLSSLGTN